MREQELGEEVFNQLLNFVLLHTIDNNWRHYLYELDDLRQGISLRAYGQKDPLIEYKKESFRKFDELQHQIAREGSTLLFRAQPRPTARQPQQMREYKPSAMARPGAAPAKKQTTVVGQKKIGRNDPS